MPPAFALAPLALAAVLVLSGVAKLPDPRSTHSMMTSLRLPGRAAHRTVARLLPWAELAVAALLLTPWRWTFALGSLAAVLLFLAFWVVVARAMTFDPRPTCSCFGRVGDHRVTGRTVVRNSVLLALALLTAAVALQGESGTGLLAEFGAGDWTWLVLAVVLATVSTLVLGGGPPADLAADTAGTHGSAHTADTHLGASPAGGTGSQDGSPVDDGLLVGSDHEVVPVRRLAAQQPQLLVLASCWCGSTMVTIDRLPDWRTQLPGLGVQLVHTHAPWEEPRLARVPGVWWDPGARVYSALQAGPSPAAVLLDTGGQVVDGPVNGVEAIERLVARLAGDRVRAPGAP
ncbi:MauE/DoxX family redox-associated membrane protein [Ornithinimicrobium sufpigmenti]|uniref:MauE/DoxX family redox-associated membrane protein n=1 Tax=Ornithinimicrobium sufpigmenti TaxID=2508882 RepID=UPI0010367C2F|nr:MULTISPECIES: MauE/DoxX family redox-associated membrane protein [unclassified Ornithinimicrobium]